MKIAMFLVGLGVSASLLGCGKKDDSTAAPGEGSAPPPPSATTPAATTTAAPIPVPTVTTPPKPVTNDADASAIRSCCAALRSAAGSEKSPSNKAKLESTASVCDAQVEAVRRGSVSRSSAIASVRASSGGKGLPGGCN